MELAAARLDVLLPAQQQRLERRDAVVHGVADEGASFLSPPRGPPLDGVYVHARQAHGRSPMCATARSGRRFAMDRKFHALSNVEHQIGQVQPGEHGPPRACSIVGVLDQLPRLVQGEESPTVEVLDVVVAEDVDDVVQIVAVLELLMPDVLLPRPVALDAEAEHVERGPLAQVEEKVQAFGKRMGGQDVAILHEGVAKERHVRPVAEHPRIELAMLPHAEVVVDDGNVGAGVWMHGDLRRVRYRRPDAASVGVVVASFGDARVFRKEEPQGGFADDDRRQQRKPSQYALRQHSSDSTGKRAGEGGSKNRRARRRTRRRCSHAPARLANR